MVNHPYNTRWPVPPETRTLIVGTAPPPRFDEPKMLCGNDFDFFYGSEDNYMWQYLDEIAEQIDGAYLFNRNEVSASGKKKVDFTDSSDDCCRIADAFLSKHYLWMKDVLETYERKKGMEHLAGDDALVEPDPSGCTDFVSVLNAASAINMLAFTSEKAAMWAMRRLEDQLRNSSFDKLRRPKSQIQKGKFWEGDIVGRRLKFMLLPSPSGRKASPKLDVESYKKILFDR